MKVLLFILLQAVYPLNKGEEAPCPVIAFDTLSAKKLLYMLDSLDFLSKKIILFEEAQKVCDSLVNVFNQKESLYKTYIQKKDKEIELLKIQLKAKSKKVWFERFVFISAILLILLLRK